MDRYKQNVKWLALFAPFRALSISAAYLTPFYLQHGLSLAQIFVLQSIFSGAFLLWELPSGYIADKLGRAFSIKLSAPIAAIAMTAYGLSNQYWQFVVWELVLALASGLVSGVDTALLFDSLKAEGRGKDFVRLSQRIDAFGFAATALGVPIALLLIKYSSVSSTLIADGLLTGVGAAFAFRLGEAPRYDGGQEEERASVWRATAQLGRNVEARWLVLLGATLSTATYLAFWLSAPYYTSLGIPLAAFSAILAARSLWKAWLSHRIRQTSHLERRMVAYALLAGLVYFAMASRQIWLVWAVLGHDIVQALHSQPISAELNEHMEHRHRATLNSLVNLVERLFYTVAGPLVGLLVDRAGFSAALVLTGATMTLLALAALARLHHLGTFRVS